MTVRQQVPLNKRLSFHSTLYHRCCYTTCPTPSIRQAIWLILKNFHVTRTTQTSCGAAKTASRLFHCKPDQKEHTPISGHRDHRPFISSPCLAGTDRPIDRSIDHASSLKHAASIEIPVSQRDNGRKSARLTLPCGKSIFMTHHM